MQLVYNSDVVINACERYLEVNNHHKHSTFSDESLEYDAVYAIYETLLRAVVGPIAVVLEESEYEAISKYLKEV